MISLDKPETASSRKVSRVRLVEAIRLGGSLGPQIFHQSTDGIGGTCALEGAMKAVGALDRDRGIVFPELFVVPSFMPCGCPAETPLRFSISVAGESIRALIIHLNDAHYWSRERIADAVEAALW
jgi:hypothetical protein